MKDSIVIDMKYADYDGELRDAIDAVRYPAE